MPNSIKKILIKSGCTLAEVSTFAPIWFCAEANVLHFQAIACKKGWQADIIVTRKKSWNWTRAPITPEKMWGRKRGWLIIDHGVP
jgi:hypothetical protein